MKTIVVFQGGGALGAFAAGAWQSIARWPDVQAGELAAVAGVSIGALNAAGAVYAYEAPERGADALAALWRERFATTPLPFFGFVDPAWPASTGNADAWNGFLTGILAGNRGLFTAAWPTWQPVSGLHRLVRPLHDRRAMRELLEREFPSWSSADPAQPLLACAAVDVLSGELRLWDSDRAPLTATQLAASSALPLQFEPVIVDGRLHWDGDVTRESLVPPLLQRLRDVGRVSAEEPLRIVTVDQFTKTIAAPPQSGAEIAYRALSLVQVGKLDVPRDSGLEIAHWHRVQREPLPEDGVSGQFDYSPRRMETLMAQGREAAERARDSPVAVRTTRAS
jgi:NTE family protein